MLVLIYRYENEEDTRVKTFTCWEMLHSFTFSPTIEIDAIINTDRLTASGIWSVKSNPSTYEKKKANLESQAIAYSYNSGLDPLSWYEVGEIGAYFEKYGKRYGLLTEFRENGIC